MKIYIVTCTDELGEFDTEIRAKTESAARSKMLEHIRMFMYLTKPRIVSVTQKVKK